MLRFVIRRVFSLIPLVIGITLATFILSRVTGVDPVAANLGQRAQDNPQLVAAFRHRWGLDKPLAVQYLYYLANLARGDLGMSLSSRRSVTADLEEYFPATMELATTAVIVSFLAGLALGIIAAVRRGRVMDRLVNLVSLVAVSVPAFWLGLVALSFLYFRLGIAPGPGALSSGVAPPPRITGMYVVDSLLTGDVAAFLNSLEHLVLPAFVLAVYWIGVLARIARASMAETLVKDYIRTARAKGLREPWILFRHALRNALIPVLTMIGLAYGGLLSGAVLTEAVFSWPGVGQYAYQAATSLDFPGIMGVTLVVSVAYVLINLLADIAYALVNPQIRYVA